MKRGSQDTKCEIHEDCDVCKQSTGGKRLQGSLWGGQHLALDRQPVTE